MLSYAGLLCSSAMRCSLASGDLRLPIAAACLRILNFMKLATGGILWKLLRIGLHVTKLRASQQVHSSNGILHSVSSGLPDGSLALQVMHTSGIGGKGLVQSPAC